MIGDNIKEIVAESHIKVWGWLITGVVIVAGAAYIVKSYYEMRNTFAQYRINQYLQTDWAKKYPDLKIKEY
jgi:hypothetical protein